MEFNWLILGRFVTIAIFSSWLRLGPRGSGRRLSCGRRRSGGGGSQSGGVGSRRGGLKRQ